MMNHRISFRMVLVVFCFGALAGCAMYVGPQGGSTATPPVNPPRPALVAPVDYEHSVQPEADAGAVLEPQALATAYKAGNSPKFGVAFYTASSSVVLANPMTPVLQTDIDSASRTEIERDKGDDETRIRDRHTSVRMMRPDGATRQETTLVSWSAVQQAVFEALRGHGIRVADTEATVLSSLDNCIARTGQGLALHTAELESLRAQCGFEVLFLVQEVNDRGACYLQGRLWDLRDGTLLGASRKRLFVNPSSRTGTMMEAANAERLTSDVLSQAVAIWGS